jgi:hypothetical protein
MKRKLGIVLGEDFLNDVLKNPTWIPYREVIVGAVVETGHVTMDTRGTLTVEIVNVPDDVAMEMRKVPNLFFRYDDRYAADTAWGFWQEATTQEESVE